MDSTGVGEISCDCTSCKYHGDVSGLEASLDLIAGLGFRRL